MDFNPPGMQVPLSSGETSGGADDAPASGTSVTVSSGGMYNEWFIHLITAKVCVSSFVSRVSHQTSSFCDTKSVTNDDIYLFSSLYLSPSLRKHSPLFLASSSPISVFPVSSSVPSFVSVSIKTLVSSLIRQKL